MVCDGASWWWLHCKTTPKSSKTIQKHTWPIWGSNHQPQHLESNALPTMPLSRLSQRCTLGLFVHMQSFNPDIRKQMGMFSHIIPTKPLRVTSIWACKTISANSICMASTHTIPPWMPSLVVLSVWYHSFIQRPPIFILPQTSLTCATKYKNYPSIHSPCLGTVPPIPNCDTFAPGTAHVRVPMLLKMTYATPPTPFPIVCTTARIVPQSNVQ